MSIISKIDWPEKMDISGVDEVDDYQPKGRNIEKYYSILHIAL